MYEHDNSNTIIQCVYYIQFIKNINLKNVFEKPGIKSTVLSMTAFRFTFEIAQNAATNVNCKS